MSVVLIREGKTTMLHYGYANVGKKEAVNDETLFQLGSCSKAFTALAAWNLIREGAIGVDSPVCRYLPWFNVLYKNKAVHVTLRQLLHHTSGIPWQTIASIPATNEKDALEKTVRAVASIKLRSLPGTRFEYATINYDILALVIASVSRQPYEDYVQQQVFRPLHLDHTSIGIPLDSGHMAAGYKIGFFRPRQYDAPVYRGNNAAGYVITNAPDMARWLKFQMGLDSSSLSAAIEATHQRDETVAPVDNQSYAAGWAVSMNGDNIIAHGGLNPNFTAYAGFNAKGGYGVAILANSNSGYTELIGQNLLRLLGGKAAEKKIAPDDNNDRTFSTVSFILGFYLLALAGFIGYVLFDIFKKNRIWEGIKPWKIRDALICIACLFPFAYGVYKLPDALAGFTWDALWVWMPESFSVLMILLSVAVAVTYLSYFLTLFYPNRDQHKGAIPKLILISALSGAANMLMILLITSVLNTTSEVKFLLFYFLLILTTYLAGRRFVQIKLIKLTRDLIYDLRVRMIEKIFSTSYQQFEKIDRGRIYTALNDDVGTIGESISMFIMLVTHFFTAAAAMLYLATMAFWATALTVFLMVVLTTVYYLVSRSSHHLFEEARDNRNVFMRLLNGMIDGFKEISLHRNGKIQYKEDVAASADEYRQKISRANIQFVKASLIGEVVLALILGTVVFAFPILFPDIHLSDISRFIIILLYLIGPVNGILQSVPAIKRLAVAWKRVQQFLKDLPENCRMDAVSAPAGAGIIENLKVENLRFRYNEKGEHGFEIGPVNLEVRRGEILFIIGGNGSGKTTLAKLLTGLYEPDGGRICIDGEAIPFSALGERFSVVFNPHYLFEKLYTIDTSKKKGEIRRYLDLLHLSDKVRVQDDGTFSTLNLSGGQRKRLALLLCYLGDSPIYLFDEWAADQDPEYRKFFYRTLLPEMAERGKIIIAITHDDHYFDVADKVLKMNQGKLSEYSGRKEPAVALPLQ